MRDATVSRDSTLAHGASRESGMKARELHGWIAWQAVPTQQTGLGLELHHHIGSVGVIVGDGMRVYGSVYYLMNRAHYGGHYTSHWKVSVAMYNSHGKFVSAFPTRVSWPVDLNWQPTRKVLTENLANWIASVLSGQHADRF